MKVTIKGIIKENREDLLVDKVIESLLGDTTYQVYHKFMGEIICKIEWPMLVTDFGYSQYEIERYLNELRKSNDYSWPIGPEDYKYLDRNYGITDETIIRKIYFKYHIILFTNILNDFNDYQRKPIDESVGNREDLLVDKISQYMLDDTEYYFHRDRVIIDYPSEGFNSYTIEKVLPLLLRRGYDINFVNYVQSTYSIRDWNLITNISQRYYSLLYDKVKELLGSSKNPMNESVERKEEMFNKIVDFMISDTTWYIFMDFGDGTEEVRVEITFPSGDADEFQMSDMEVEWDQFYMNETDKDYLEDQFGITERWITQELYNRYINKLRPIIYEEMVNYNR